MESAWPRTIAASRLLIFRAGSGNRALPGARPGRSAAKVTSSSGALAMARRHDVTARLTVSVGSSFGTGRNFLVGFVIVASKRGPITAGYHYSCPRRLHPVNERMG